MDKSERGEKKKCFPFVYLEQEICPWIGKYTPLLNTTILMSEYWGHILLPQQTRVLRWPYLSAPFSRFFPPLAIHICHPCARLPGGSPCWTHGVGPEPKMGIYEPTSALTDNWLQARAKTVWCWLHVVGIRHWGEVGEAQTLSKRISILSSLAEQWKKAAPLPRGKCIYV